jgi:hypothetical protein
MFFRVPLQPDRLLALATTCTSSNAKLTSSRQNKVSSALERVQNRWIAETSTSIIDASECRAEWSRHWTRSLARSRAPRQARCQECCCQSNGGVGPWPGRLLSSWVWSRLPVLLASSSSSWRATISVTSRRWSRLPVLLASSSSSSSWRATISISPRRGA